MAKYHEIIPSIGMLAGEDLSASSKRYLFVALSSSPDKVVAGTGGSLPGPFGILQTTGCSGHGIRVLPLGYGFSKLVVDAGTCAVNIGNFVTCASDGQGEKVTSASALGFAMALEQVTSGSAVIEVMTLSPGITVQAAS